MATPEEKKLFRLFNEVQRNYTALSGCFEGQPVLLMHFLDQLKSITVPFDDIASSQSSLSQRLAEDIKAFVHDMDILFFSGYKGLLCSTSDEHIAIEAIFDIVEEFRCLYPLEDLKKPQQKPYRTEQAKSTGRDDVLPVEAAKFLKAAVNAGLLSDIPDTNNYDWKETKSLLVYFIVRASAENGFFTHPKSKNKGADNGIRIQWNKWKMITKVKGKPIDIGELSKTLSRIKTTNEGNYKKPQRAQRVDGIFDWKERFSNIAANLNS